MGKGKDVFVGHGRGEDGSSAVAEASVSDEATTDMMVDTRGWGNTKAASGYDSAAMKPVRG
jgi:hypothetical protein